MSTTLKRRSFASDNNSGIHPAVVAALQAANAGDAVGYGDDPWTAAATARFRHLFGADAAVYFVFNGTGANVLGLSCVLEPFQAVLCARGAHIDVDECGAPERAIGCKLIPVATPDGKLTPALIAPHLTGFGVQHHVQPGAISIAQSTELGTVYTAAEIRAIADVAHAHRMVVHVDGARIANAAAALALPVRAFIRDAGVDVVSFGGTKNGLMLGEAVVLFEPRFAERAVYLRKQQMQLASKMRFIAAQFDALLAGDLWLANASQANRMAALLARRLGDVPEVAITRPVQANAVFAIVPRAIIAPLQQEYFFYVWDEARSEVRWMTSFDTTEADVAEFVAAVQRAVDAAAVR